ncbi:hypothetical protein Tco_1507099 [Tanacetum coccineum]
MSLRCSWCGGPFNGGNCRRCTNVSFEDEFVRNPDPISYDETPNFSYPPPQPQTCSYELCGNDSHYGFDCPPRFPLYSIDHQEDLNQQRISDVHIRWDKIEESLLNKMKSFWEVVIQQKHTASIDQSPLQEISIQEMEDLKQHYLDEMLSLSKFNGMSIEINKKKELQHLEQVANLSTYPSQRFKSFCYDDDDDYDYEESVIPLNEIDSQIPPSKAITPVLRTLEPEDSLIMGDDNLSTILEKESDEFLKSSVEDLVPIPSESEDTSGRDSECDLPSCDDFSPINNPEGKSVTFSNPL